MLGSLLQKLPQAPRSTNSCANNWETSRETQCRRCPCLFEVAYIDKFLGFTKKKLVQNNFTSAPLTPPLANSPSLVFYCMETWPLVTLSTLVQVYGWLVWLTLPCPCESKSFFIPWGRAGERGKKGFPAPLSQSAPSNNPSPQFMQKVVNPFWCWCLHVLTAFFLVVLLCSEYFPLTIPANVGQAVMMQHTEKRLSLVILDSPWN